LRICRRFKPLFRRPVWRASALRLGDKNLEFDSGHIREEFDPNE
jgi:hypothetical protein